jgi:hypothetical protein
MTQEARNHKRRDDELICICGHEYHSHSRVWDPKKQLTSFANVGSCTACDCVTYTFNRIGRAKAREVSK